MILGAEKPMESFVQIEMTLNLCYGPNSYQYLQCVGGFKSQHTPQALRMNSFLKQSEDDTFIILPCSNSMHLFQQGDKFLHSPWGVLVHTSDIGTDFDMAEKNNFSLILLSLQHFRIPFFFVLYGSILTPLQ